MVFDFFKKKNEEAIQQSLNKYKKILYDDLSIKMNITYAKKVYSVDIDNFKNREIVFRFPIENKNEIILKIGQTINADFISQRGLFSAKVNIRSKSVENSNTYYTGVISTPVEKNQRRNNYRLPLTLNVSYLLLPNELRTYHGTSRDISAGGMLMESAYFVAKDRKIKVFFELNNKMYRLNSTIVRSVENKEGDNYLHHIRFDFNNNRTKNEIAKFVFDEERKGYRRNKY